MTLILYPTRGSDPTYRNQDRVIALGKERDADLLLLYVSNIGFLDHFAAPVPVALIEAELDEMGEFLLAIAQERAEQAGIQAGLVVRHGLFGPAVKEVIAEHGAATVVLGLPAQDTGITTKEYIYQLAQFLVEETGVEVLFVDDGEIVTGYPALEDQEQEPNNEESRL